MPCFNEEPGLPQLKQLLAPVLAELASSYDIELVFVDDGCTDRTVEVVCRLWPEARVVSHESNRGLGAGMRSGATASGGELVMFFDCDCSYRPAEIPALLRLLDADTDIVTASPYHARGGVEGVPGSRLLLSRGLSLLYRIVTRSSVATYTSMFRVYRRPPLDAVWRWSDGFVACAETLVLPMLQGFRVREYPTVLHRRQFSFSKIRIAATVRDHLKLIALVVALRLTGRATRTRSRRA